MSYISTHSFRDQSKKSRQISPPSGKTSLYYDFVSFDPEVPTNLSCLGKQRTLYHKMYSEKFLRWEMVLYTAIDLFLN